MQNNNVLKITYDNPKLVIHGFMGGSISLPMRPKIKRLTLKNEFIELTPEENFKSFIEQLWQIPEAREVFELFGAEFKV